MTLWSSFVLGFGFTVGIAAALMAWIFVFSLIFGFGTFGTAFMESYRKSYRAAEDKKRAEKENRGAEVKHWPAPKGH